MLKKSFFAVLIIVFISGLATAQVPNQVNYQGRLTDAGGNPVNATISIQFKIYDAASVGTMLWNETQSVTVTDGIFSVLLGSVTPIPYTVFDGTTRYLGITVGVDPEMTPRKALVSVGYAYRAYDADKLDGKDASAFLNTSNDFGRSGVASDLYESTTTLTDKYVNEGQANSISTAMIQNDAVTSSKITPDFVSSINGVKNDGGNIDLVAGSNISINPDNTNNKITISASTSGGDNLGNHTATQNIKLNNKWLSNDGGNEGLKVDNGGNITTNNDLNVGDDITATDDIIAEGTVTGNCTSGSYGVYGKRGSNFGYIGSANYGVHGNSPSKTGVYGQSSSSNGVSGWSSSGNGVRGYSTTGFAGYFLGKVYMKGKVGIGTESPDIQLVVKSSGYTDGMQVIANDGSRLFRVRQSSDGSAGIYIGDSAGNSKVVISGNGKVGIKTDSPNYELHVVGSAAKTTGSSWISLSDERLKDVNGRYTRSLEAIEELNPVYYTYKKNNPIGLSVNEEYVGLLAQEVQKVIPEAVGEYENGYLSLNNDPIIWTMLNAIKELKVENETIRAEMSQSKAELETLKSRIIELESAMQKLLDY